MATREQLMIALRNAHAAGDTEAANRIAQMIKAQSADPDPQIEPSTAQKIVGGLEVAGAVASGFPAQVAGGVAGIPVQISESLGFSPQGSAARVVSDVQDALTYEPKSNVGQQYMSDVGGFVNENIAPYTTEPLEALANAGGNYAIDTGQGAFNATVMHTAPLALAELLTMGAGKGISAATRAAKPAVERGLALIPDAPPITQAGREGQALAQLIKGGSESADTAPFMLPTEAPSVGRQVLNKVGLARQDVVPDDLAREAISIGVPDDIIPPMRQANPVDKQKMLDMVNIMERGSKSRREFLNERPMDVAGRSLQARVEPILQARQAAGRQLDAVARDLKNEKADFTPAVNALIDDLDRMGVELSPEGKIKFEGSDIEGLDGPEKALGRLINRMRGSETPTAYDAHRLKRYIDETVSYGKTGEGLTGKTAAVIKNFRHNLDSILDENFPEYNRINTAYFETTRALDELQDIVGKRVELDRPGAAAALGNELRKLESNYIKGRQGLPNALKRIDETAEKYYKFSGVSPDGKLLLEDMRPKGKVFQDDLATQVMFASSLDEMFGPAAKGSFENLSGRQVKKVLNRYGGGVGAALSDAADLVSKRADAEKAQTARRFEVLREMLRR